MKTSVTSYSFGGYIAEDRLGYLGLINKAKEMGFDGIEYTDGGYMNEPESAKKIRERAAEQGIEVVALAVGANFIQGSGGNLKDEIARVCRIVDYAAEMGAKLMRHDVAYGFGGERKHTRGYDDALPRLAEGCREVTKYAEQKGVKTMTENHGYFSQDALRVEKLINTVGHDNFGALVDLGNFMCADEDPSLSVSIMAPYAFHVHAKDFHYKSGMDINPGTGWFQTRAGNYLRGAIIGHGEAKIYQSIQTLKKNGYDGYVTVEFEGMEDNLRGIEVGHANLKRFIG
ncbi:MAG: sugar phosphate isomerase/epimerase [Clostridia bacterium]|nr:sugar phosphate isomerase/epimerase [Clostridia bacterium]